MGRKPCCVKQGLNRGAWTAMEDRILCEYIKVHGEGKWKNVPTRAGLKRCGKSCRLRWMNYLRPDIKRGNITPDEEELIIRLHKLLGNRWSLIAGRLPGRTDNEIKNYWNTYLSKRENQHKFQSNSNTNNHKSKPQVQKMNKRQLKTNQSIAPTDQPVQSNVIRTKAVRCTRFTINPRSPQQQQQHQISVNDTNYNNNNDNDNNLVSRPSSMLENVNEYSPVVDGSSSLVLMLDEKEENNIQSEFMADSFNVEDPNLISELLNMDFLDDVCDFSNVSIDANYDVSSTSPDQPVEIPQEMLEDWLGYHQQI